MTSLERDSPVQAKLGPLPRGVFDDFYRDNYVALLMFATSRVASSHDAEELVAEAFIVAWKRHSEGSPPDRAWLFGVLKNKIRDHRRRAHTMRSSPVAEVPDMPIPSDDAAAAALRVDVQRALAVLTDSHREALILTYWCDLSTHDAAKVVGISHGAYRVRLTRAKQQLCRATQEFYDERK